MVGVWNERRTRLSGRQRRGAVIVLTTVLLVLLFFLIAVAIDIGYIQVERTSLQAATDATALAAAGVLMDGTEASAEAGVVYLQKNPVTGRILSASDAQFEFGFWDPETHTFTITDQSPNAVRVTTTDTGRSLFFGGVLGKGTFDGTAQAIATYQPRDIALVLDYSGSMCYDSQFRNISLLGKAAIEANLLQIYNELGSPTYGSLTFTPVSYGSSGTSNSKVLKNFGLDKVAYPYKDGSWSEWVDYVQTDSYVNSAGYRNKYGYMTWINYLLAKHCGASDTAGLWATSEQPITALKDAVDVFLAYLGEHSTEDRASLSIYTYSDGTAILEQALTTDYSLVSTKCRQRQAGHYTGATNISAGMNKGRIDLQDKGRPGALRMMVLITDGVVNMPTGNSSKDKALVLQEAQACADAKIPVVTIALGAFADVALMQQVADISGGACFVVEGGRPIEDVKADLEKVFHDVAADRPLRLVQ